MRRYQRQVTICMIDLMNKPVQVALHGAVVIALFFGLAFGYQACLQKKPDELSEKDKAEQQLTKTADENQPEFFEDEGEYSDSDLLSGEGTTDNLDNSTDTGTDTDEERDARPSQTTPAVSSRPTTSQPAQSQGRFLIIAGNYLIDSNADNMVANLKRRGYNNAQVTVFDLSQYYTVVAGRYASRSLASSVSSELKNAGIDNYIIER